MNYCVFFKLLRVRTAIYCENGHLKQTNRVFIDMKCVVVYLHDCSLNELIKEIVFLSKNKRKSSDNYYRSVFYTWKTVSKQVWGVSTKLRKEANTRSSFITFI